MSEELLRGQLQRAIAAEDRLHQEAERCQRIADRWQRRAELALQRGDEEMGRGAIERRVLTQRTAHRYEAEYRTQAAVVRDLKDQIGKLSVPRVYASPYTVERRLDTLQREDRLERDLQALKTALARRSAATSD